MRLIFNIFLVAHVITGATGLVTFWVPVIGRKGGEVHKRWGKVFAYCLLATGTSAIGMSVVTLIDPLGTHRNLSDAAMIRGLFGWMMLYLATMTICLAWYGLLCVRNRGRREADRHWLNVTLQYATLVTALNCAVQGYLAGQPLMMLISLVGIAAGLTDLLYIYRPRPPRGDYLKEHVKGLVGAGISVYTAFLAFGAAQLVPAFAFNPVMWATPVVLGISLIVYHRLRITAMFRPRGASRTA